MALPDGAVTGAFAGLVVAGIPAMLQWMALRGKTKVEIAQTYQDVAQEALVEAQAARVDAANLRLQLRTHERRWALVVPILQQIADKDPVLGQRMLELKLLNGLANIDVANQPQ